MRIELHRCSVIMGLDAGQRSSESRFWNQEPVRCNQLCRGGFFHPLFELDGELLKKLLTCASLKSLNGSACAVTDDKIDIYDHLHSMCYCILFYNVKYTYLTPNNSLHACC